MKTKLQVQGEGERLARAKRKFQGPLDCAAQIYHQEGVSGLYCGLTVTLIRDIPTYAQYFGLYYILLDFFTPDGKTFNDLGPLTVMFLVESQEWYHGHLHIHRT